MKKINIKYLFIFFIFFLTSCSSVNQTFKSVCTYYSYPIYSHYKEDKSYKFNIRNVYSAQADEVVINKFKNKLNDVLKNNNLIGDNYYIDVYIITYQPSGLNKMASNYGKIYFNKKSYFTMQGVINDFKNRPKGLINIEIHGKGGISDNTDQMINEGSSKFVLALKKMLSDKSLGRLINCN